MDFQVVCATDEDLSGMRNSTLHWLQLVDKAANCIDIEEAEQKEPLLLMFVYCGHGAAGRFFPVDAPKRPSPEESYCFFEDFLFRLYDVLSFNCRLKHDWPDNSASRNSDNWDQPSWEWRRWPAQIISVIESCRRLSKDEQKAYELQRARIATGRRHLLPSVACLRPDLAPMGGAEWDAAHLSFLSQLGPNSPQLLLALSSESTTPSYDVVYLRSIVEQIDKPVRFVGMLERASLDTLRKTGHKQKPVMLLLCDRAESSSRNGSGKLQELILAQPAVGPPLAIRRSSSSPNVLDVEKTRLHFVKKEQAARCLNSRTRPSLPLLT